jgi:hypothetical protein
MMQYTKNINILQLFLFTSDWYSRYKMKHSNINSKKLPNRRLVMAMTATHAIISFTRRDSCYMDNGCLLFVKQSIILWYRHNDLNQYIHIIYSHLNAKPMPLTDD